MTDTMRRIRSHAHRIDVQCERYHPGCRGNTYLQRFIYDERHESGVMTMRAILKCSLPATEGTWA